jgi:2-phospho-L-lactate guanylyltransferase
LFEPLRTLAILPIKTIANAKQRLAMGVNPGPRRTLVEAMFCDVLVALRRASAVEQTLVVTVDHGAQRIAGGYGAAVLDDDEAGHSEAAAVGIRRALEQGYDRVLLVPGDCPMLDPAQVDELIGRPAAAHSVLVVPDRHGTGTNALLLTPPDPLLPSFGPGSRDRHVATAHAAGMMAQVVEVPSLALDVDTPDDLSALERVFGTTHGGAAHTRGAISQFLRSGV